MAADANFVELLPLLQKHEVEFIVIDGGAAIVHGLARATYDVDIVYRRTSENIRRLVTALSDQNPYLRGAPSGLPFCLDERNMQAGLNFALTTRLGNLDLFAEVPGGGTYDKLLPFTEEIAALGVICRFVTLEHLIHLKQAAGRPKDIETIAELRALLLERKKLD